VNNDEGAHTWALVLAAGEGRRLRTLTTAASGRSIPKQFCSLYEGPSLLHEAIERARAVASRGRTCAVVAEQHRCWWMSALATLPAANVIVQPENRGTANGILLPILHIAGRDPKARVVLLPSDHHVRNEGILAASLLEAVELLHGSGEEVVLLGLHPEDADPEFGYIVPRDGGNGRARSVERFVEKPSREQAASLIASGALWNAFIIASSVPALLAMFRRRIPEIVTSLEAAVRSDPEKLSCAIAQVYERIPVIDFCRDILSGEESHLKVLPVPSCGWSDLGTPRRVADALCKMPRPDARSSAEGGLGQLSLAAEHERLLFRTAQQYRQ